MSHTICDAYCKEACKDQARQDLGPQHSDTALRHVASNARTADHRKPPSQGQASRDTVNIPPDAQMKGNRDMNNHHAAMKQQDRYAVATGASSPCMKGNRSEDYTTDMRASSSPPRGPPRPHTNAKLQQLQTLLRTIGEKVKFIHSRRALRLSSGNVHIFLSRLDFLFFSVNVLLFCATSIMATLRLAYWLFDIPHEPTRYNAPGSLFLICARMHLSEQFLLLLTTWLMKACKLDDKDERFKQKTVSRKPTQPSILPEKTPSTVENQPGFDMCSVFCLKLRLAILTRRFNRERSRNAELEKQALRPDQSAPGNTAASSHMTPLRNLIEGGSDSFRALKSEWHEDRVPLEMELLRTKAADAVNRTSIERLQKRNASLEETNEASITAWEEETILYMERQGRMGSTGRKWQKQTRGLRNALKGSRQRVEAAEDDLEYETILRENLQTLCRSLQDNTKDLQAQIRTLREADVLNNLQRKVNTEEVARLKNELWQNQARFAEARCEMENAYKANYVEEQERLKKTHRQAIARLHDELQELRSQSAEAKSFLINQNMHLRRRLEAMAAKEVHMEASLHAQASDNKRLDQRVLELTEENDKISGVTDWEHVERVTE